VSYRVKRSVPRGDDSTSVPPDNTTELSPASNRVYSFSNAIVGHAARVHASAGPAVSVSPARANVPPQVLQSTRVDSRPSAKVKVYVAPQGCGLLALTGQLHGHERPLGRDLLGGQRS
jgi:hypothetical protein